MVLYHWRRHQSWMISLRFAFPLEIFTALGCLLANFQLVSNFRTYYALLLEWRFTLFGTHILSCLYSLFFFYLFFVGLSWLWNFLCGSLLTFSSFSVSFALEQCFIRFHHLHFICFSFLSFVLVQRLYCVLVLSRLSSPRASQSHMFDQFTSRKSFSWCCFFLEIMGRLGFLLMLANTQHTQNLTSPKKKKNIVLNILPVLK